MVWKRDKATGRWVRDDVADATVKLEHVQKEGHLQPPSRPSTPDNEVAPSPSALPTVHQNYQLSRVQEVLKEDTSSSHEEEDKTKYHIVKPGESFHFICLKYRVTADALRAANANIRPYLKPTQKLVIPSSTKKVDKKQDILSQKKQIDSEVRTHKQIESKEVAETVNHISSFTKPPIPIIKRREEEEIQYHWVEPDDSLRWICLKYKVTANEIRKANNFTGSNLRIAPKRLIIPKPNRSAVPNTNSSPRSRRRKSGSVASIGSTARSGRDDDSLTSSLFSIVHEHGEISTIDNAPMMTVRIPGGEQRKSPLQIGGNSDSSDSSDTEEEKDLADIDSSARVRYHDVRPTDTIEYLCMKYRVSAPALRQANIGLTGRNLQTGPKRLIIPPPRRRPSATPPVNTSFVKKGTQETHDTVSVATFTTYGSFNGSFNYNDETTCSSFTYNDETNTIALSDCLSDGYSTITDQIASLGIQHNSDDSEEEALYHDVRPNDTLQGVCLLYGISAHELRRANKFRGINLASAPERLKIPRNERNTSKKDFKSLTDDEKVQTLIAHLPVSRRTKKPLLSHDQARQYLKTNNWNFNQALRNVKVDMEWSQRK